MADQVRRFGCIQLEMHGAVARIVIYRAHASTKLALNRASHLDLDIAMECGALLQAVRVSAVRE